ncbi:chemotaxis protein CheW [Paenibacillus sp. y28]|uniref:chemotaxis protein CheW n=1 Tax=Paenibacillus sp. y28 TaxID=3129110 RepID=UPI003018086F
MKVTPQDQYVEVGLDNERYAIPIGDVREIIRMMHITVLPRSKAYLKGVIHLRNQIIPVVSLRLRLGLQEHAATKASRIVVVNFRNELAGLIVDQVHRVSFIPDVGPPMDGYGRSGEGGGFGMARTDAGLVSILSLDRILGE